MNLFKEALANLWNEFKQRKTFAMQHRFRQLVSLSSGEISYDVSALDIHKSKDEDTHEYLERIKKFPKELNKEILIIEDCLQAIEQAEKAEKATTTNTGSRAQLYSGAAVNRNRNIEYEPAMSRGPMRGSAQTSTNSAPSRRNHAKPTVSHAEILKNQRLDLIRSTLNKAREQLVSWRDG
ncbi:hypothetical protein [Legionella hackeliae]|uniref:Uncharacterized protein n=1 Tax=Legionella hackeliae TaxID=449 RepID=A0A0A8UXR1_LEGHA|nr:hypothetical protein [Legionella hackeliae]KTD13155.1 hypothetical protein Lhac_1024 [Legionella hackeliae]CEK11534.1 protein of unknown function [Legionella hackeliae]STX48304.1 Uncharacterised protein [Legionella hackeliae]